MPDAVVASTAELNLIPPLEWGDYTLSSGTKLRDQPDLLDRSSAAIWPDRSIALLVSLNDDDQKPFQSLRQGTSCVRRIPQERVVDIPVSPAPYDGSQEVELEAASQAARDSIKESTICNLVTKIRASMYALEASFGSNQVSFEVSHIRGETIPDDQLEVLLKSASGTEQQLIQPQKDRHTIRYTLPSGHYEIAVRYGDEGIHIANSPRIFKVENQTSAPFHAPTALTTPTLLPMQWRKILLAGVISYPGHTASQWKDLIEDCNAALSRVYGPEAEKLPDIVATHADPAVEDFADGFNQVLPPVYSRVALAHALSEARDYRFRLSEHKIVRISVCANRMEPAQRPILPSSSEQLSLLQALREPADITVCHIQILDYIESQQQIEPCYQLMQLVGSVGRVTPLLTRQVNWSRGNDEQMQLILQCVASFLNITLIVHNNTWDQIITVNNAGRSTVRIAYFRSKWYQLGSNPLE